MLKTKFLLIAAAALLASACDEGRIYQDVVIGPQEGRVVKLHGDIQGIGRWANGYQLVIAGFADSEYAEITKEITGDVTILSGVPDNVTSIEICAINRLRKRIVTFDAKDIGESGIGDTIRWEARRCGGSMFDGIQHRIFNTTCANCHGTSNFAAAGLYLTEGKSYDALVNAPSTVSDGDTIVIPGQPESSLLYHMLSTDLTSTWKYDHSVEIVDQSLLDMISAWIENDAQK